MHLIKLNKTYSVTNVTSVLSSRGNEYCVLAKTLREKSLFTNIEAKNYP